MFFHVFDASCHERQSAGIADGVHKLLLLGGRLTPRPLYFDCQENAADDVLNAATEGVKIAILLGFLISERSYPKCNTAFIYRR
jgi:hypothetical protein